MHITKTFAANKALRRMVEELECDQGRKAAAYANEPYVPETFDWTWWLNWEAKLGSDTPVYLLAWDQMQPVGFALMTYSLKSPGIVWLRALYVEPTHRSKGIGRMLIERALLLTKLRNDRTIPKKRDTIFRIGVIDGNPAAAKLYASLPGFFKYEGPDAEAGGDWYDYKLQPLRGC